jgi:TATA-binding protein-associated factor
MWATVLVIASPTSYIEVLYICFQLLDLFSLDDKKKDNQKTAKNQTVTLGTVTMKTVLETLPDLWEEKQYEEEYDLTNFVNSLRN